MEQGQSLAPEPQEQIADITDDGDISALDLYGQDGVLKEYYERRDHLLKDIDYTKVREGWFTLSHLLLAENAKVVDMGCGDGLSTYIMAALSPNLYFTGIDKDKRKINKARQQYSDLHNIDFEHGPVDGGDLATGHYDAIVNSNLLHDVFSQARYNDGCVSDTLSTQMRALKPSGIMYIRDFARPPPEQYVLMEMPEKPSDSDEIKHLSEPDLLVWYSENARPKQDPGCGGFFLEELPARRPYTRLFRLPYKWAYEFIMRKDDRDIWDKSLPVEYTFFTEMDFRKELRDLGMRVEYSAPLFEEDVIEKRFEKSFRLFDDQGKKLGYPPTGFVAVARKMTERKSLNISERRPAAAQEENKTTLHISAMRNEKNGQIVDVVTPEESIGEIIPYRINLDDGRLKVYLHDGVARALSNTVMRQGKNIDGKRWSGHMVEPISVYARTMESIKEDDVKDAVLFSRDHLGLKPQSNATMIKGPDFYPSPDYIDERIFTHFLSVQKAKGQISPKSFTGHSGHFLAKGAIREFDAQQVLNGITVGMMPNSRLELQLLMLFEHLKIPPENWIKRQMGIANANITSKLKSMTLLKMMANNDHRFKDIRGTSGQLRNMHSIFVEEGQTQGAITGLTSNEMDFVISDERTVNTAVVVALNKDMKGDLHAGFAVDHLPVPQRHEGNGLTMRAPSFDLPDSITNLRDMKEYLAEKLNVMPDMVVKMGESYYTHIGMTPHRVYPFAVSRPPSNAIDDPLWHFIPIHQFRVMWKATNMDTHLMTVVARSFKMLDHDIKFGYKKDVKAILTKRFGNNGVTKPDWSIPISYIDPPGKMPPKEAKPAPVIIQQPLQTANIQVEAAPAEVVVEVGSEEARPIEIIPQRPAAISTESAPAATVEISSEPLAQPDEDDIDLEELAAAAEKASDPEHKPQPEKW